MSRFRITSKMLLSFSCLDHVLLFLYDYYLNILKNNYIVLKIILML